MVDSEKTGFSARQFRAAGPEASGPAPLRTPIYQTSAHIYGNTRQSADDIIADLKREPDRMGAEA